MAAVHQNNLGRALLRFFQDCIPLSIRSARTPEVYWTRTNKLDHQATRGTDLGNTTPHGSGANDTHFLNPIHHD